MSTTMIAPSGPTLTQSEERDRIIMLYGRDDIEPIMGVLERQLAVLMNRAQLLLGLCGIAITTTGFSGRLIAGTSRIGQELIIGGLGLVLVCASILVWGVLRIVWMTQTRCGSLEDWLIGILEYRDRKTRLYRIAIVFLLLGLALYVGAIAVMLLNPQPVSVPVR